MTVHIEPLPTWARKTKFRPQPQPMFDTADPTPAEVELALALFDELDPASRAWYGGAEFVERLRARRAA